MNSSKFCKIAITIATYFNRITCVEDIKFAARSD